MDSSSSVISFSQNAKLQPESRAADARINAMATAHFTGFFFAEIKYRILITASTPEKIRNVKAVPTAGMVTNVGRKVPIMLPMVFNAPAKA